MTPIRMGCGWSPTAIRATSLPVGLVAGLEAADDPAELGVDQSASAASSAMSAPRRIGPGNGKRPNQSHAPVHSLGSVLSQARLVPCARAGDAPGVCPSSAAYRHSHAPPPPVDVAIARIAARQNGAITLLQLLAIGLTRSGVVRRVRAGRLHRIHRGVYAVGHPHLSREGQWMAAVLAAGEGSGLSHLSAAVHLNAWRRAVTGIDVIAPTRRTIPGVRLHRCRHLDPRDLTVHRGIPVTTMARTLVDLTDVLTERQLANVIHEAAFRNRFSERATRAAMARAPGRRLRALERALEAHASGSAGTKSELEDQFLAQLPTNLPSPLVNAGVQTPHKLIEVDLVWPELKLCVEVDGHGHERPRTQHEDAERDRLLEEVGYSVLRLGPEDLGPEWVARVKPPPRLHRAADPRPP